MANTLGLFDMAVPTEPRLLGPGTGMEQGELMLQRRRLQEMALEEMAMGNKQKGAEYSRYTQSTPHMVDQLRLGNESTSAQIPGQRAQSDSLRLKSDFEQSTQPGRIASTNIDSVTKYLESGIRNLELSAAQGSPMVSEAAYQDFKRNFPDQEMAKRMPQSYDPSVLPGLKSALMNSPAHRRSIDEINTKGGWDVNVANINAASAKAKATIANSSRERSYADALNRSTDPGHRISIIAAVLADPEASERLKATVKARLAVDAPQLAVKYGVQLDPPLPGLPDHQALRWITELNAAASRAGQPAPQPQPGAPQPGAGGPINFGDLK